MKIHILLTPKIHEALHYAESKDGYNEECSDSLANAKARDGMNYTAAALTSVDINVLTNLFNEYMKMCPPRLLREIDYASIAMLMPSADSGFPHTRPDRLICFPQSGALPSLQTFIHELWHIHQRAYPGLWKKLYMEVWGFKEWRGGAGSGSGSVDDLPDELQRVIRINPDTMLYGLYCWRDEWVPIPVFLSPSRPRMNDCAVWFWNIRTKRWRQSMPDAWSAYFSSSMLPASAHEHPNELSAYMLSTLGHDMRTPPAFADLVKAIGVTAFYFR